MSQRLSEHTARRRVGWKSFLTPLKALSWLITRLLLLLLGLYRRVISPGLRPRCRFLPSCSEYAEIALRKHGLVKGTGKTLWRLARCHPLCKGGYDEP
jgi:putative membrane protein insertion efficiency factor